MSSADASRIETDAAGTWLAIPRFGAPHRFGTRTFLGEGVSAIDGLPVIRARQVHRNGVLLVGDPGDGEDWQARAASAEADAVAIGRSRYWAGVSTADCLPLLLYDPVAGAVAAVHAGWRGALTGVAPAALCALGEGFGSRPQAVEAAIGPHIGVCCFEVGPAVLDALAQFPRWERWVPRRMGEKGWFDLRAFVQWQLQEAGVAATRIWAVDRCTRCEGDLFSSYRREGLKPRGMLSAVRLPARASS